MKKVLTIVLSLLLVLTLFGCGKSDAVKGAESLINDIGEVTLDSKAVIEKAEAAVQALSEKERSKVEGLDILEQARTQYDALVVVDMIANVGDVTLDSGDVIADIDNAYKNLSADSKSLVDNYSIFESAKATYVSILAQKGEEILGRCRTEEDKVYGITYYYPNATPIYGNERSYFSCYIGAYSGQSYTSNLFIECDYFGDSWVFWKKLVIVVDGVRYTKTVNYGDISRQVAYGDVFEWFSDVASEEDMLILKAIANSNEAIVRFEGDDKYYDLTVPQKDKNAIKDMLILYRYFSTK